MRHLILGAALGAVLTAGILAQPAAAPISPTSPSAIDRLSRLERRVATLERLSRLQSRWNAVTSERQDIASSRITDALNRELSTSSAIGTSVSVAPRTWGYVSASCITGTLVAGGLLAEWPMEIGGSELVGTTWRVAAYNPYFNESAFLRGRGVCLSLR